VTTVDAEHSRVRVERGRPDDDELAALVAVLLSRVLATDPARRSTPSVPLWPRTERVAPYRSPRSWRR
jgi:hypothetical protein